MRLLKNKAHVRLGSVCSKIGSGATPRGGDGVYIDAGTSFIRSQNVYNGIFETVGLAYLTEQHSEQLKGVEVESRDVLLNITGDSVARCCQVPDSILPARVNQHVSIIRPDEKELLPEFLCYYLISPLMQKYLLSRAGSGGTRKALTKGMIEDFEIPKPAVAIQHKIVDVLSSYGDLIENNRRRIQLLEQAARLLYKEWFVHLRFSGHEHTKIIDGVPEGWEKKPLGTIAPLKYGKALKNDDRVPGPFPVYGSSGIVGTHTKPLVAGPTIIVGRKGNVGSVYWSLDDCHPIDTVYYIDPEHCSLFLYYALQQMNFISTDVAVPGLNRDFAHSCSMLVADQKILRLFDNTISPLYQQMELLKRQNTSLAKARDLLLPKLMNGEVAV